MSFYSIKFCEVETYSQIELRIRKQNQPDLRIRGFPSYFEVLFLLYIQVPREIRSKFAA